MRNADAALSTELPFLARMRHTIRERLLHHSLAQRQPAGTILFKEGDRPDYVHILVDGTVELLAQARDSSATAIEMVQPREVYILAAALTDDPDLLAARTHEQARRLLLPTACSHAELTGEPALSPMLLAERASHYLGMMREVKNLNLRISPERIGCFLITRTRDRGDSGPVTLPCSKRMLAQRPGMTPGKLPRACARLRAREVRIGPCIRLLDEPRFGVRALMVMRTPGPHLISGLSCGSSLPIRVPNIGRYDWVGLGPLPSQARMPNNLAGHAEQDRGFPHR